LQYDEDNPLEKELIDKTKLQIINMWSAFLKLLEIKIEQD
jgi:hypothetical protein